MDQDMQRTIHEQVVEQGKPMKATGGCDGLFHDASRSLFQSNQMIQMRSEGGS
jgi:hypothetical protein